MPRSPMSKKQQQKTKQNKKKTLQDGAGQEEKCRRMHDNLAKSRTVGKYVVYMYLRSLSANIMMTVIRAVTTNNAIITTTTIPTTAPGKPEADAAIQQRFNVVYCHYDRLPLVPAATCSGVLSSLVPAPLVADTSVI